MIRLTIKDSPYVFEVEFRHARVDGPRPALGRRSTVAAITTCVILAVEVDELEDDPITGDEGPAIVTPKFMAISNAVCERGDNFSRRTGRWKAFIKAVRQCGMLDRDSIALVDAYNQHDPGPPRRAPVQLAHAEVKARWEAGWEKRKQREVRRSAGSAS